MQLQEINNKYFTTQVRWGIVRNKNLSDQLDSSTVVLTDVSAMNIEAYDLVVITNENEEYETWLVANVNKEYVTYTSPFKFDYTLDLMSLTKWFETIPLPSMSITNIGQNRSIKSYIQRVVERYVLPECSNYITSATYTGLDSRFDAVCPEMKFEQTTVREYLDWMVGHYGYVIKATYTGNGNIDIGVLDLNNNAGALPSQYIDDIKEIASAQEYVTQFEHNLQEVIAQEPITEYVTLKSDSYVFNSDNAVCLLSHKPYDIKKIVLKSSMKIHYEYHYNTEFSTIEEYTVSNIDLTDYFLPEAVFNTLPFKVGAGTTEIADSIEIRINSNDDTYFPQKGKKYQLNTMYWNRGNNKLQNINVTKDFQVIFGTYYTMPTICAAVIWKWLETNFDDNPDWSMGRTYRDDKYWIEGYDWSDVLLEVTYIPYISPRLLVEQKDNFSHLVTMQDNSTNTQTELTKFLAYSLEKNSKLGNNSKIFTAMSKVTSGNYAPKFAIGQTWKDETGSKYVLSTLEYSIFQNSILYKGTLTKNYTNRNLSTIINREKRYYSLPDASEVVERKEITKEWYIVQLFSNYSGQAVTTSDFFEKPLFALFFAYFNNSQNPGATGTVYVDSVYGGNLIAHNISFMDNISFATKPEEITTDGFKMEVKKYVDDNGELTKIGFRFGKSDGTNQEAFYKSLSVGELELGYEMLWDWYNNELLKDSRERISWSLERIFYSNNENIILGNNFAELFQNATKRVYISYAYSNNGVIDYYYAIKTATEVLTSNLWSQALPSGKTGTLTITDYDNLSESPYLTIYDFDAGDYLVFTTGSKRG